MHDKLLVEIKKQYPLASFAQWSDSEFDPNGWWYITDGHGHSLNSQAGSMTQQQAIEDAHNRMNLNQQTQNFKGFDKKIIMENKTVYAFKAVTGEETMARIVEEHADYYLVDHPVTLMQDHKGISLVPAVFIGNLDQHVELRKSAIIFKAEARTEIANKYIEAVTGIVVAPKSILLT